MRILNEECLAHLPAGRAFFKQLLNLQGLDISYIGRNEPYDS
jgi:hypothetical protein